MTASRDLPADEERRLRNELDVIQAIRASSYNYAHASYLIHAQRCSLCPPKTGDRIGRCPTGDALVSALRLMRRGETVNGERSSAFSSGSRGA